MEQMASKGVKDGEESGTAVRETVTAMKSIAEKCRSSRRSPTRPTCWR